MANSPTLLGDVSLNLNYLKSELYIECNSALGCILLLLIFIEVHFEVKYKFPSD